MGALVDLDEAQIMTDCAEVRSRWLLGLQRDRTSTCGKVRRPASRYGSSYITGAIAPGIIHGPGAQCPSICGGSG